MPESVVVAGLRMHGKWAGWRAGIGHLVFAPSLSIIGSGTGKVAKFYLGFGGAITTIRLSGIEAFLKLVE